MKLDIRNKTIAELLEKYPYLSGFFQEQTIDITGFESEILDRFLNRFEDEEESENSAISKDNVLDSIFSYVSQMQEFLGESDSNAVESITILPGTDKSKVAETFNEIKIKKSEIICIVGPTGSGKSRLLADIEWVAQKDTPTSRTVLVNDKPGEMEWRFNTSKKLVAQLSQNMNFVMDLSAYEFVELHAQSRLIDDVENVVNNILEKANELAGEKFAPNTPITSLSGGQSRALMIADTAYLSKSPIVLIDEIENAGIDRKKAVNLLIGEEKIVLMATHDPILALMGDKRIVIKNGGVHKVIETSDEERKLLADMEKIDHHIQNMRNKLRQGEILTSNDVEF